MLLLLSPRNRGITALILEKTYAYKVGKPWDKSARALALSGEYLGNVYGLATIGSAIQIHHQC